MKPIPKKAGENINATPISSTQARQMFLNATLNMSWQLAIAVLVPVIGGYELDKSLKSSPAFTIVGLVIAIILCMLVVGRVLKMVKLNQNVGKQ